MKKRLVDAKPAVLNRAEVIEKFVERKLYQLLGKELKQWLKAMSAKDAKTFQPLQRLLAELAENTQKATQARRVFADEVVFYYRCLTEPGPGRELKAAIFVWQYQFGSGSTVIGWKA